MLCVEDNPLDAALVLETLRGAGLLVEDQVVWTEPAYRRALAEFDPDVILCDFAFPNFDGETALRIGTTEYPAIPLIFVSGTLSEERFAIALQNGAVDYIQKSRPARLPGAVLRALERAEHKRRLRRSEIRVARLSAIRDVMSAVDRAIARHSARGVLFQEACNIATNVGNVLIAGIATREGPAATLKIEAWAGPAIRARFQAWLDSLSPLDYGSDTLFDALRTKAAFVVNDLADDLSLPKRRELWAVGVRSMGAFPLIVDGEAIGAMVIATGETGFFNAEEIGLVTDVAGNLSFALEFINGQRRVDRLSRIRDLLSAVNETIVRVTDGPSLFREVCRIACELAGYVSVFVVALDTGPSEHVRNPAVIAGAAGGWAQNVALLERTIVENLRHDRGLVSAALRTLRPQFANDLQPGDEAAGHVHPSIHHHGVRAIGAFPLTVENGAVGVMVFDTIEAGYFDAAEIALLTNLTNNVSFALDHIGRRERLERLSRIRDVLSAVNAAIVRIPDRSGLCHEACRIAVDVGGFARAVLVELDGAARERGTEPELVETSLRTLRPAVKRSVLDGTLAAGSFPIVVDGLAVGAMVFETSVREYFDTEELELLTNLTNNLAFGLSLIEKQRRVDYLSYYDVMTQLPNRLQFYDTLGWDIAAAKKAGKSVALVIVDVSRFSVFNNTLGELVGDEALRKIASRLGESVEAGRIARVGGDQFALSFPMIDDLSPVAALVTEDGLKSFEAPFTIGERELHLMARAGCAVYPGDGAGPEELFQNAETALLSAKTSGATYRLYSPELNVRLAKQLDLEGRLQRAIAEQQFVLFFQPKVAFAGTKIVGFEGLIRWNEPGHGLVFPGAFIPMLERTGMIIPVGRWALLEAARQYEEWRRAGREPPRIAMNLSAVQLRGDRLVDDVRAALECFEDGCGLDLEVTESMLVENVESAIEKLSEIKALGPHLSLDDFGTGYSSLSYLHQLPLHALKIDRSFVSGMRDDANKLSIVSTIVSLGKALGLTTIAEGVETAEDAELLERLGCDQMQGFYISRAVPAEEAARFLRS